LHEESTKTVLYLIFRLTTSRYTALMKHSRSETVDAAPHAEALAARLRAAGLAAPAAALLDALAPLAPLGAQALYIAQPLAGVASADWRVLLGDAASVLEQPGGVDALRRALVPPTGPSGD
jgi:hypothetical protein